MINKTTNTKLFIVYNLLVFLKNFAYFKSHFSFLVWCRNIFKVIYYSTNCNIYTCHSFCWKCVVNVLRNLVNFFLAILFFKFLYENNTLFVNSSNKILLLCWENTSNNLNHIKFLINFSFNEEYHSRNIIFNTQFLCSWIYIYKKQVIKQ